MRRRSSGVPCGDGGRALLAVLYMAKVELTKLREYRSISRFLFNLLLINYLIYNYSFFFPHPPILYSYRHSVPRRERNVGGHRPTDEAAQLLPAVASRYVHHEQPLRGHRVVHVAVVLQVPLERLLGRRALGTVHVLRAWSGCGFGLGLGIGSGSGLGLGLGLGLG